jgi:hypothetical protein
MIQKLMFMGPVLLKDRVAGAASERADGQQQRRQDLQVSHAGIRNEAAGNEKADLSRRLWRGLEKLAGSADAPQQLFQAGGIAILFVVEDRHVVDKHDQIPQTSALDLRPDAEFGFRCFLEADGLAAQVRSEEATLDFNSHRLIVSFL